MGGCVVAVPRIRCTHFRTGGKNSRMRMKVHFTSPPVGPSRVLFVSWGWGWIQLNLDAVLTVLTNTQVQVWYNTRGYIVSPHDHTNLFCFILYFLLIPTFSCILDLIFTSLISTVSICLCMHCLFGWKSSFPSLLHLSTLLYLTSLPHLYPSSLPHLRGGYSFNKARMLVCLSRNE